MAKRLLGLGDVPLGFSQFLERNGISVRGLSIQQRKAPTRGIALRERPSALLGALRTTRSAGSVRRGSSGANRTIVANACYTRGCFSPATVKICICARPTPHVRGL